MGRNNLESTTWIVQNKLNPTRNLRTIDLLRQACNEAGCRLLSINVTAHSNTMPEFEFVNAPLVVVMDIAGTPQGLKVIELNCFNGSGFYLADIGKIVRNVSRYIESLK